jgi:putative pantetheine hydrolase
MGEGMARRGTQDAITDVAGLRVGHAQRTDSRWLAGTTVVPAPGGGAVAAVDVRGGGPGTRETDALDPRNLPERIDAVVLTGARPLPPDDGDGVPNPAFAVALTAAAFNNVLAAGADTLTRAIVRTVLAAEGIDGPGGVFPAYRDLHTDL